MPLRTPRALVAPLSLVSWKYGRPGGWPSYGRIHLREGSGALACGREAPAGTSGRPILGRRDLPTCEDCRSVSGLAPHDPYPSWSFHPDSRGPLMHLREQGRRAVLCGAVGPITNASLGWCQTCLDAAAARIATDPVL